MKTIFKTIHCAMLISLFVLSACTNSTSTKTRETEVANKTPDGFLANPPKEDTLSLCGYTVSTETAGIETKAALDKLRTSLDGFNNPADTLPRLVCTVNKRAIDSLRASLLLNYKDSIDETTHFLSGIKMSFGLKSSPDRIFLLFQPVFLKNYTTGQNKYKMHLDRDTYLKYETSGFVEATPSDTLTMENYQNTIWIKRTWLNALGIPFNFKSQFVEAADSTGDTESMVFTFQEIDSVLKSNNSNGLRIWNYVFAKKVFNSEMIARTKTKHSLLLGPDNVDPIYPLSNKNAFFISVFKGKFANRSHMCPPSCDYMPFITTKVEPSCK